jgi:hypothetical protein
MSAGLQHIIKAPHLKLFGRLSSMKTPVSAWLQQIDNLSATPEVIRKALQDEDPDVRRAAPRK